MTIQDPEPAAPLGTTTGVNQRIRIARESSGLTQAQAAELSGVAKTDLARVESGTAPPSHGLVDRLSRLFGIAGDWLSGGASAAVPHLAAGFEDGLLDRAVRAHIAWRRRLVEVIQGPAGVPFPADESCCCDFGVWLDGQAAQLGRHPLFPELAAEHRHLHDLVASALRARAFGQVQQARDSVLSGSVFDSSVRLIGLINRMRHHTRPSSSEIAAQFPTWKSRYLIGHPELDAQHQELFRRTADIHMAVVRGEGWIAIRPLVEFLVGYAEVHFRLEESVWCQAGCPGLDDHVAQHRQLAEAVAQVSRRLEAGEDLPLLDVCWFLSDWLRDHIITQDLPCAAALRAAGMVGDPAPG